MGSVALQVPLKGSGDKESPVPKTDCLWDASGVQEVKRAIRVTTVSGVLSGTL